MIVYDSYHISTCVKIVRSEDVFLSPWFYTYLGSSQVKKEIAHCKKRFLFVRMECSDWKRRSVMTLGPLEYLVVGFEGNRFTGQILAELRAAREKGIIRVVDLFVLKKDEQGNVTALELSDLSGEEAAELGPLAGDLIGLLAPEDIEQVAAGIPNNSAAGLLLFEHTWAIGLKEAIKHAGGIAVGGGFVAPDVLQELEKDLEAVKQGAGQEQAAVKAAE
jgi:Family of unknown function (DUF6325)